MANMKILVTGARGMLGRDFVEIAAAAGHDVASYGHDQVDLSRPSTLNVPGDFDWCVNCAAYANVDGAETHASEANEVNADGAGHLARWCRERELPLLHISTDYVFDGTARTPYLEDAPINPLGVYAKSKARGEFLIRSVSEKYIIARTQGLFGRHGRNFIQTILKLLQQGKPLRVVNDQWTAPTYTRDLACGMLNLLDSGRVGTVHVSSEGECSWYELACFIRDHKGLDNPIEPVDTCAYPLPARRPAYSILDKKRLSEWTGRRLPDWKVAVRSFLRELESIDEMANSGSSI